MKIAVILVISCFIAAAYSDESLSKLLLLSITINDIHLSIDPPHLCSESLNILYNLLLYIQYIIQ